MDALIVLFIIGGIIISVAKKAKRTQQKKINPEETIPTAPQPAQEKIPYTKAEWEAYLRTQGIARKGAPAAAAKPAQPTAAPDSAVHAVTKPSAPEAGSREMVARMHRSVEHSISEAASPQGESESEHAEHLHKMFAADSEIRAQNETAAEFRRMNRTRLRQAIVMREILDRPVSLREE